MSTFAINACIQSRDDLDKVTSLWETYKYNATSNSSWIQDSSSQQIVANYRRVAEEADADDEQMAEDDLWPRVKMCMKCKPIPLWQAMAILPPELREVERTNREKAKARDAQNDIPDETPTLRSRSSSPARQSSSTSDDHLDSSPMQALRESILTWLPESQAYTLVPPPKPERTHHCSICKTCIIKYDHHCPWLNQCVGLYNERYFVLFLIYLSTGCMVVVATGWRQFWKAVHLFDPWYHPLVPRPFILLTFLLAFIMGICLIIMGGNHLLLVSQAETSVENADADQYRHLAKRKGRVFRNVYDLGRRKNLSLFWNLTPTRSTFHALLPYHFPPYSDGWHWAKRRGLGGYNWGVSADEEFTDDEEQEGQGEGEVVGRIPKHGTQEEIDEARARRDAARKKKHKKQKGK